jgi:HAD superfamily hydrolase (TIGR01450 family)
VDIGDVLCDLDGVVWRAESVIPGAVDALRRLSDDGARLWFVTNNSNRPAHDYAERLESLGLPARGKILTSAMAAATLVMATETVMACAGPGVVEAITDRGATVVDGSIADDSVDAVIVGLHREFDYVRLANASAAVRAGARLIGTNHDPTFPTPRGQEPGGGSILAAVATASARSPILAGKPHEPMAALVRERLGEYFDPTRTVMVGDRPSTDGRFAQRLGVAYWQVGREMAGEIEDAVPITRRGPSLADVVASLLGSSR